MKRFFLMVLWIILMVRLTNGNNLIFRNVVSYYKTRDYLNIRINGAYEPIKMPLKMVLYWEEING